MKQVNTCKECRTAPGTAGVLATTVIDVITTNLNTGVKGEETPTTLHQESRELDSSVERCEQIQAQLLTHQRYSALPQVPGSHSLPSRVSTAE